MHVDESKLSFDKQNSPKERKLAAVSSIKTINLINHPSKVIFEDHHEQTSDTSGKNQCRRASLFKSREKHHRDFLSTHTSSTKVLTAPIGSVSRLFIF